MKEKEKERESESERKNTTPDAPSKRNLRSGSRQVSKFFLSNRMVSAVRKEIIWQAFRDQHAPNQRINRRSAVRILDRSIIRVNTTRIVAIVLCFCARPAPAPSPSELLDDRYTVFMRLIISINCIRSL